MLDPYSSAPCSPLHPPDSGNEHDSDRLAANNCDGGVVDFWQSELTGHPGEGGCTATACPVPNGTFEPYCSMLERSALSTHMTRHNHSTFTSPLTWSTHRWSDHQRCLHSLSMGASAGEQATPTQSVPSTATSILQVLRKCAVPDVMPGALQSMVNVLDSLVGNLTAALTTKGMMENLVFVYSVHSHDLPSRLMPKMLLLAQKYISS